MQYGVYGDVGHWNDPFYKAIYLFHMPLFMALSGFLSRRSISEKPPISLAWQRFQAYILPIFSWALIAELSLIPFTANFYAWEFLSLVLQEAFASLWFLWCLYAAMLISIILSRFGKWAPALAVITYTLLLLIPDFFHLYLLKYTLPFFWLGIIAARPGLATHGAWKKPILFGISLALTITFFFLWREETYIYLNLRMSLVSENIPHILVRYAAGITGSLTILTAFWFFLPRLPTVIQNSLTWFGRRSLPIYIIQGYIFLLVTRVSTNLTPELNQISRIIVALVLGLLVTFLTGYFGELLSRNRFANRFLLGQVKFSELPFERTKTLFSKGPLRRIRK